MSDETVYCESIQAGRMKRIEFIGLPGAGKSAIRNQLLERLTQQDKSRYLTLEDAYLIIAKQNIDRVFRPLLNVLPHRMALAFSNKLMNRSLMHYEAQNRFLAKYAKAFETFISSKSFDLMSLKERNLVLSAFIGTGALYECIAEGFSDETFIFFEEGFVQKSLMFIPVQGKILPDSDPLSLYLQRVPLPEIIIFVQVEPKTCLKRMTQRPEGLTHRLENVDDRTILSFLNSIDEHLNQVRDLLHDNPDTRMIEINNEENIHEAIACLQESIAGSQI